uniref:Synapse defective Rho GTPase homolog 2 n=1 Tax=Periophthalmus magnuspinnatus TaxID=409849 RepID=A0A3B4A8L5_9GOBI
MPPVSCLPPPSSLPRASLFPPVSLLSPSCRLPDSTLSGLLFTVTVNKMQEWMHKGRLLSSEMKQRIEGSSPPLPRTKVLDKSNIQPASCANGREGTTETSGWRPPLNTITVSKKRNWLQQSSLGKSHFNKDETQGILGAEEEGSHLQHPSPSPSPDHLKNTGSTPSRPENDADDEGDIWYNPIPEDDEPDQSHGRPSIRLLHPPRERRGGVGETAEAPAESTNVGDAAQHSSESIHVHRQILACRNQDDCGPSFSKPTVADGTRSASAGPGHISIGFSPPSSPNPTKKSSAINWSFPDKIKSPRTVRKISMKMKKLPELSRKLSVKGPSSSSSNNNSNGANQSEQRSSSPKNNGTEAVSQTSGPPRLSAPGGGQASRNVISRYHLDSSVSTQGSFSKKKSRGSSKSASKGGYLSDGDSPELVAKSGKHGSSENKPKSKEMDGRLNNMELDIDAFRHYSFTEQPKCSQYISGLMNLHFYGAEDLKPPRIDSRDVYCAIQVDSVNKARTALLTCRTTFLDMDHTFNIELENAQHLKLVVFSWEPMPKRNKVCCHGTVVLPTLFRVTRTHQLAVKLEPRGLIYVKLSLMEQWQNSLDGPDGDREPVVFGVEAWRVVERENMGLMVPLLISKCINEIEKRGCQVVGLYRLCGSAAVKKELREAFERDSPGVELCENTYPDINVITGVLKDYLRELPYPLINKPLYEAVLESMALRPLRMGTSGCENDPADSEHTVGLLDILPDIERMTLHKLLDHLKLVASYQEVNKMTCQNLAVCFGPVLLSQRQEATCHSNRVFIDSEELASALHFKKHIEVLHYLLQLWPGQFYKEGRLCLTSSDVLSAPPIRRRKERPQVLNFTDAEMAGVLRPKPGRLDSPSNRYAGDWSGCGENYFPVEMLPPVCREEADYDDVASEDNDGPTEEKSEDMNNTSGSDQSSECVEQEQPLSVETEAEEVKEKDQINLRDLQESIDTLIGNLERELNKNKLNVGY